ncbi:MAG: energy transducer TonB [Gemmatimonadaceae bacterium]|nr:energy transducer TonB [Gemmatimonadaceae bacterium]
MLQQLLESKPARERSRAAAAVSVIAHTTLIAAAIVATRTIVDPPVVDATPTITPIYRAPDTPRPAPVPRRTPPRPAAPDAPPVPAPAPTTPTVAVPTDVPTGIPDPDPGPVLTMDPVIGTGTPGVGGDDTTGTGGTPGGEPFWGDEVERVAAPIGRQREPRYPDVLRAQRIEGAVTVAFVVGTDGRVEPASVRAVESTHALFEPAVRAALLQQRFRPAEWRGRKVRQLVQQRFVFTLAR